MLKRVREKGMSSFRVSVVREPEKNSSSPIVRSDCVYKSVRRSKGDQYDPREGSKVDKFHVIRRQFGHVPVSDEKFSSRPSGVARTYSRYISRTRPPPPYKSRVVRTLSFLDGQTRLRLKNSETKSDNNSGCCCASFRRELRLFGDGRICRRLQVRESRGGMTDREATILAGRSESESLSSAHDVGGLFES